MFLIMVLIYVSLVLNDDDVCVCVSVCTCVSLFILIILWSISSALFCLLSKVIFLCVLYACHCTLLSVH